MVEDCVCEDKRKRVWDDSGELDENVPESKIARVDSGSDLDSAESRVDSEGFELVRVDSGSSGTSDIQDDLLDILDDSDNVPERDPTMEGLDSVIKSFEEEILAQPVDPNAAHESCDLRHLLEASDDELGLPPTVTPPAEEEKLENDGFSRVGPDGIDLSGFLGFEDDIPHYESLGYGTGVFVEYGGDDNGGGFVTLDGLFDYAEPGDVLWRSESLQAM